MDTMSNLEDRMRAAADPSQVEGLSRFFKTGPGQYGEGDKFLGIKVPVTRSIVKACWRETDWAELERCMASEYHEVRLAALLVLVEIFAHAERLPVKPAMTLCPATTSCPTTTSCPATMSCTATTSCPATTGHLLRQRCVDFYLGHTGRINNWDLVDLSCYPLLGEWLLPQQNRSLLYNLARNGRTIWEQRIGIVSTMTFVRHGQLADTFAIADILLHHPHDLIHKAVGWLLREAGKRDREALEGWLQGTPDRTSVPRYRRMPRTMLRYAIEKFPEADRQRYLHG